MRFTCDCAQESIRHMFRYQSMDEAMMPCAEPHVNMNYMHAPDYELQIRFLKRYMAEVASSERSLTLVLSVGYWVWTPDVPQVHLALMCLLANCLWLTWRITLMRSLERRLLFFTRRITWTFWSP